MSNPVVADGHPIPEGVIAAVDETVVELQGGVTYVLVSVIFADAQAASRDMQTLTADRTRPLHWHREGPRIREAAVEHIEAHAATTRILAQRSGRQAQTRTRATLLAQLVTELTGEGVGHLIIESRGQREDGRDRSVILDCLRNQAAPAFTYDWRTKAEPLLWYPDALAGVAREHLTEGLSADFNRLHSALVVTDIRYVDQRAPTNA